LMFTVLSDTGVRWGEFCELRARDLKHGPDGAYIAVRRAWDAKARRVGRPKSGKSREIPVSPQLARSLWRLQRRPDELLFTSPRGERLHYQNTLRRVLVPILKTASAGEGASDVTWAGFHAFRHTFATLLIVVYGVNVKRVSKLLGHHAASYTLDVYTHLFDEDRGPTVSVSEALAEQRSGADGGLQGACWEPATPRNQPNVISEETADLQAETQLASAPRWSGSTRLVSSGRSSLALHLLIVRSGRVRLGRGIRLKRPRASSSRYSSTTASDEERHSCPAGSRDLVGRCCAGRKEAAPTGAAREPPT
jgi:Phage integrase family